MKKFKLIFGIIIALFVLSCGAMLVACNNTDGYNRTHDFEKINANAVFHIERTRLTFVKDMEIDQASIIENCGCVLVDPDTGEKVNIKASDLTNGIIAYERFDLSTAGRDKRIKLSFKEAENYIFYDVLDFQVNFYEDSGMKTLWRSTKASAALNRDTLDLSVWIDTFTNNYATDEDNRKTAPEKAMRFNGWYDQAGTPVTGRYVLTAPAGATERVVNLYADFLSEEQFAGLKLGYDTMGRLVFYGYDGKKTDEVRLPEGVTYIDMQSVFEGVTDETPVNFKSLYIPSTARTDLPLTSGYNTAGLESVDVDENNPYYSAYHGALYAKDYQTLLFMPTGSKNTDFHELLTDFASYSCAYWQITTLALPETVTILEDYCFAYSHLTSVAGLSGVLQKTGVFLGAKVNSYEDGIALYTVLSEEGESPRYSLSMILNKSITQYTVVNGTVDIAGSAFSGCDKLVSVDIGNMVKSIGESAFSGCSSLKSITLPSTLESLGSTVFYDCISLEEVKGITDVTYVDGKDSYEHTLPSGIFYNCSSLISVVLPDGLLTIGPSAFRDCSSLAQVNIPSTVENIGSAAFRGCGVTSITLPAGLENLGQQAFMACANMTTINLEECVKLEELSKSCFQQAGLTTVTLPEKITVIPAYCFYNMANLVSIDLSGIEEILDYGVSQNKKLTTINFGTDLVKIGTRAFSSDSALTTVVIPDSVTSIGNYAFASCSKLAEITLGKGLKALGTYSYEKDGETFSSATAPVFYLCKALKTINVAEDNAEFVSIDGILYGKKVGSENGSIDYGTAGVLYTIPSNYQATSVTLPSSVRVVLPYSASQLQKITELNLNTGLINIGKAAFYQSTKLTKLTLPSTVGHIGASILLGCTGITEFEILQPNDRYETDGNLVYEGNKVVMYMGITPNVVIKNGITEIASGVFMQNKQITSLVISDSVTTIGDKAFAECSELTTITIGKGLKNIDAATFASLPKLETITVDADNPYFKAVGNVMYTKDGKKVVLAAAQNGMTSLESLLPEVNEIGEYAFSYHATLSTVVLPEGVTKIDDFAFYECRQIEYIRGSELLETIGVSAFAFLTTINPDDKQETRCCDTLKTVLLYENLTKIDVNAFYGHYGIEHVYFKMSHVQVSALLSNSGKNYIYLTKGCPLSGSTNRFNEVECHLYTATEPTIDYDGYSWFYFDEDGEPQLYKKD